jgi:hypothetical protein
MYLRPVVVDHAGPRLGAPNLEGGVGARVLGRLEDEDVLQGGLAHGASEGGWELRFRVSP